MNTLLLCIDFINDIVHPDGKIAASARYITEQQTIEHANTALQNARKNKILIAQVKVGFSKDYCECPKHSPLFGKASELGALQLDSWGCELHQSLNVDPHDMVIIKHRVSALYATSLPAILCANQITQVVLCGVSTNMAIETTARELHDRDYEVLVLENACAAATAEIQKASLLSLARIAKISSAQEWAAQY